MERQRAADDPRDGDRHRPRPVHWAHHRQVLQEGHVHREVRTRGLGRPCRGPAEIRHHDRSAGRLRRRRVRGRRSVQRYRAPHAPRGCGPPRQPRDRASRVRSADAGGDQGLDGCGGGLPAAAECGGQSAGHRAVEGGQQLRAHGGQGHRGRRVSRSRPDPPRGHPWGASCPRKRGRASAHYGVQTPRPGAPFPASCSRRDLQYIFSQL
mmetsp:Transcript_18755/g.48096  ORF Transcript_18755/g.48096 Transcript_18755/m.48096 type:complete len:209 (+) Transcript_18755:629-1255(+)